jgi:hypothetical protein
MEKLFIWPVTQKIVFSVCNEVDYRYFTYTSCWKDTCYVSNIRTKIGKEFLFLKSLNENIRFLNYEKKIIF